MVRRSALALVLISLASCQPEDPPPSPPNQAPQPTWTQRMMASLALEEYRITPQDDGFKAHNRAQGLALRFERHRVTLTPSLSLAFQGLRRGQGRLDAPVRTLGLGDCDGQAGLPATGRCLPSVRYSRQSLTEWYHNRPSGLEQGFHIPSRPLASSPGLPLEIHISLDGADEVRAADDGMSLMILAQGKPLARYGELHVTDGQGREVPAELSHGASSLILLIHDQSATYPLDVDPLITAPGWSVTAGQPSDLGASVATAGDIDGDGYSDIIVGAPLFSGGGQAEEGKVFLYLGSPDGPSLTADWSYEPNIAGAHLGEAVATAGDVNGDGLSDILIGAPGAARALLFLGSPTGLAPNPDWTYISTQPTDRLGAAVSTAGDTNGDGRSDVVIGAPAYTEGQTNEGRALVFLGQGASLAPGPSGVYQSNLANAALGSSVSLAGDVNGDGLSDGIVGAPGSATLICFLGWASGPVQPPWVYQSPEPTSLLGASVSTAGDVNGDGYADIIAGAPGHTGSQAGEGQALIFLGSPAGLIAPAAWSYEPGEANAALGSAVSTAGDVNGDGYADVAIGAPGHSNTQTAQGQALVFLGSPAGPAATPDWTYEPPTAHAALGSAIAPAGDVNGDGYSDIIAGAPGHPDGGGAYLFTGGPQGLATAAWSREGDQWSAILGSAVASAGDINGDGYEDMLVAAPGMGVGEINEGHVFLYLGSPTGPAPLADWSFQSDQANARLGSDVCSAGDVNGDGYDDIIIACPLCSAGQVNEGQIFVFLGSPTGLAANPDWSDEPDLAGASYGSAACTAGDVNNDGYGDIIVGATGLARAFLYLGSATGLAEPAWSYHSDQATSLMGSTARSAGDINNDGFSDIIIGAPEYDGGHNNEGKVFLFLGSPSGPGDTPDWTYEPNSTDARLGSALSSAGDTNGDGYSDIIIGAPGLSNGQAGEGRAYVFLGGPSLAAAPDWTLEANQIDAALGSAVSSAGDVNGDGFSDILIGAPYWGHGRALLMMGSPLGPEDVPSWTLEGDLAGSRLGQALSTAGDLNGDGYADIILGAPGYQDGQPEEGQALFLYGNGRPGMPLIPAQWVSSQARPIQAQGLADGPDRFRIRALAHSPLGRSSVRLEWEVRAHTVPFTATATGASGWFDASGQGTAVDEMIAGLASGVGWHWRIRLVYDPTMPLIGPASRWVAYDRVGGSVSPDLTTIGHNGDPCSADHMCLSGHCVAETCCSTTCDMAPPECQDYPVACDDGVTCTFVPLADDTSCDDATVCNGRESCQEGACVPGEAPDCDDDNPCTNDSCDPVAGCLNEPVVNGTSCDDATVCNGRETCQAGLCTDGVALSCQDGDVCTDDICDPVEGCQYPPADNGTPCDDTTLCNGRETCQAGACAPGLPLDCDDLSVCTVDSCDPAAGCVNQPLGDGLACDDATVCNGHETCQGGACAPGLPLDCADTHLCTIDSCDPVTGCRNTPAPNDTPCDDATVCNGRETCQNSVCMPSEPPVCQDFNVCTTDICDPVEGCRYDPVDQGTPCDDATVCNGRETCQAGVCSPGDVPECDDQNICTQDHCHPVTGCFNVNQPDDWDCSDGNMCNGFESCQAGLCQGTEPMDCSDGIPCTLDLCDAVTGCSNPPAPNDTPCDDATVCNGAETCQNGACVGGPPPDCDDHNACTTDSCDQALGCLHDPVANGLHCDDADLCNGEEVCQAGVCVSINAPDCTDGDPCTEDNCHASFGCQNPPIPNGGPCDDATVCNGHETCQAGICSAGTALSCGDTNPCTLDECDPVEGCRNPPLGDGTFCDDEDRCNGRETCQSGVCTDGAPPECVDGNPCTEDMCLAATGCYHPALPNNSLCDDATVCNGRETCQAGECISGAPLDCADDNPCTVDGCDAAAGCRNLPAPLGTYCDDDDRCNGRETCQGVLCLNGPPPICNDDNICTTDSCDPASGCRYEPQDGLDCGNGLVCDGHETCQGGLCGANDAVLCDDPPATLCVNPFASRSYQNPGTCMEPGGNCTYGFADQPCPLGCDGATGLCEEDPCQNVVCNDPPTGDCINPNGWCAEGVCHYDPRPQGWVCDDQDDCTTDDACNAWGACLGVEVACQDQPPPECLGGFLSRLYDRIGICDEGDCTYGHQDVSCSFECDPATGLCTGDPCAGVTCNRPPGLNCYENPGTCLGGACFYDPLPPGDPCTDSNICTTEDGCNGSGACVGQLVVCDDPPASTCASANTAKVWVNPGTCSYGDGECDYTYQFVSCAMGCDANTGACRLDPCDGILCLSPPGPCHDFPGVCVDGACEYDPSDTLKLCDDQNLCTTADHCDGAGGCTGSAVPCLAPPPPACIAGDISRTYDSPGSCDRGDGLCDYLPVDNYCSTRCVSATGLCEDDPCGGVTCNSPPGDQCWFNSGTCLEGLCFYEPLPPSMECDDEEPCTAYDVCDGGGGCSGEPVGCTNPPHALCADDDTSRTFIAPGTCEPISGDCIYSYQDHPCDEGCNPLNGYCHGDPCADVVCDSPPSDQCWEPLGTCLDGLCSYQPLGAGEPCDDGELCTIDDSCDETGSCDGQAVLCHATPGPECIDPDTSRLYLPGGSCDPATGECAYPYHDVACPMGCVPATGGCNTDPCWNRVCDTPPSDQCWAPVGTCEDGLCVYTPLGSGEACDDDNACTTNDGCNGGGACLGQNVICNSAPPAECINAYTSRVYQASGSCDISSGDCLYDHTDSLCIEGCDGLTGLCTGDPCAGVVCDSPPADQCWLGAGDCVEGICFYQPMGEGEACDDDLACTIEDICDGEGTCSGLAVDCSVPPLAECLDGATLRSYQGPGECNPGDGLCEFGHEDTACPFGCEAGACVGDPCLGVTCTTEDPCVQAEGVCVGGDCSFEPLGEGEACDDGSPCTTDDVCDGLGACLGDAVACLDPPEDGCFDAHTARAYEAEGTCHQGTGECEYLFEDTACPFGCEAGVCLPDPCEAVVCDQPPEDACLEGDTARSYEGEGTCDHDSGECEYPYLDTLCPHGCEAGACLPDPCEGVVCQEPPGERCWEAEGECLGGECSYEALRSGTPCDDDNLCTYNDGCDGEGGCVGRESACPEPPGPECLDPTHSRHYEGPGACDPATGECSYGAVNQECLFGCDFPSDLCLPDPCQGVECLSPPRPSCYDVPGTCAQGVCSYRPLDAATACDDGLACTEGDECNGDGLCQGEAVVCTSPPRPECLGETSRTYDAQGACDPTSGLCAYTEHTQGCEFGCDADTGLCAGDPCAAIVCHTPPSACYQASGVCQEGSCTYRPLAQGLLCDDGDACTGDDRCDGQGACLGLPMACLEPPADECVSVLLSRQYQPQGICDPLSGECGYTSQEVECPGGCDVLTGGCRADLCAEVLCHDPPGECWQGECIDGACEYTPVEAGRSCDDGDPCTHDDSCDEAGACVGLAGECADGGDDGGLDARPGRDRPGRDSMAEDTGGDALINDAPVEDGDGGDGEGLGGDSLPLGTVSAGCGC